jgi:Tol biopolymer transport system component
LLSSAWAQEAEYNHPELKWRTYQTEHFVIYFHQGEDYTASVAGKIAEEVYGPITSMYDYRPSGKVHLIFQDTDDIANAETYFNDNKIRFWTSSLDWEMRGTHYWLRNVITHEFTHIIQLGASRKWTRRIPGFYVQVLAYEEERRPDVLYGYPNVLCSYAVPVLTIPGWFAEGTAQYQNPKLGNDYWDSQRDMVLRSRTLGGTLLTYDQMGVFDKTSLDAETVYNQGFALVRYIANRWGDEALKQISISARNPLMLNFDSALKKVTGLNGHQIYDEWKTYLEQNYTKNTETIKDNLVEGRNISHEGTVNLSPVFSPDGTKIAYFGNEKRPYWSQTNVLIYNVKDSTTKSLGIRVVSGLSWSPDGQFLTYARRGKADMHGSSVFDIYIYDTQREEEFKLTNGLRAENPSFSADSKQLVCTVNKDGIRNLAVIDLPELTAKKPERLNASTLKNNPRFHQLTQFQNGEQVFRPRWSPDGSKIIFTLHHDIGRAIATIPAAGGPIDTLLSTVTTLRDPVFSADGNTVYYSSDETGIFNIYSLDLRTHQSVPLTNVLGGAFMPDVHGDSLTFCQFTAKGFVVSVLDDIAPLPAANLLYIPDYASYMPVTHHNDVKQPLPPNRSYKPAFMGLSWLPRIAFDYGSFKPGVYLYSSDFLDKLSIMGGFAINGRQDHDLFAMAEFKGLPPTVFAELYNIVRNRTYHFADSTIIVGEVPTPDQPKPIYDQYRIRYNYNLTELDFGLRYPLSNELSLRLAGIYSRYISNNKFDDGTAISLTYYKGWAFQTTIHGDFRAHTLTSNIHPIGGREFTLQVSRENNNFFREFEINADRFTLQEVYTPYNYDRFYGSWIEYQKLPFWKHAVSLNLWGGMIDHNVDDFFDFYAGGLNGMKGYSFYSIGGRKMLVGSFTYRFPIMENIDVQKANLFFHHIYGGVFADVGNAWDGAFEKADLKKDAGMNLRLYLTSFYVFPTAIEFSAAYGFNRFTPTDNDFQQTYGKEWRYYFTLLFDFINNRDQRHSNP